MTTPYLSSSTSLIEDPGSLVFPSFENKTPLDSAVAPLTLPSPAVGRGLYYAGTVGLRYACPERSRRANPTYLAKRRPLDHLVSGGFQVEDRNIHRTGESGHPSVIHRSLLSSSNSPSRSWSGATGSGVGGFPASASIGLLVTLGGPISAITRPRFVTRTVSPDAASRTYSLSRLLSTFIPTDLMDNEVATGSYFVKPAAHSTRGLVTLSGYATPVLSVVEGLTRPTGLNRCPLTPALSRVGERVWKCSS